MFIGVAFVMIFTWNMFLRSSTQTAGTITDVYLTKGNDLPIFTFTALNGETYQVRNDRKDLYNDPIGFWRIGDATTVHYVTNNPKKARAGRKTWEIETLLVVVGAILLIAKVVPASSQNKAE